MPTRITYLGILLSSIETVPSFLKVIVQMRIPRLTPGTIIILIAQIISAMF